MFEMKENEWTNQWTNNDGKFIDPDRYIVLSSVFTA